MTDSGGKAEAGRAVVSAQIEYATPEGWRIERVETSSPMPDAPNAQGATRTNWISPIGKGLAALGAEGWELISILDQGAGSRRFYFKRPVK